MMPAAAHWPPMFIMIQSEYWIGPSQPGGVTSGQRFGPSFLSNVTATPSPRISSSVIFVVTGQLAMSGGELKICAPASAGSPAHVIVTLWLAVPPNQRTASWTICQLVLIETPVVSGACIGTVKVYVAPGATESVAASHTRASASNASLSPTAPSLYPAARVHVAVPVFFTVTVALFDSMHASWVGNFDDTICASSAGSVGPVSGA